MRKLSRLTITIAIALAFTLGIFAGAPTQAADNRDYPVLLIHGLASDSSSWKDLPKYLTNRGIDAFVMDFNDWSDLQYAGRKDKDMRVIAAVIARQINLIKSVTGKEKVNIIAHSIAGLAVRAYIADYGRKVENRGRYGNDVNRVVYLSTPFFGFNRDAKTIKLLLKDTDWGPFMDRAYWTQLTQGLTPELIDLCDYFEENADKLNIEEVTVYSEKDHTIKNYQANLDGTRINPFFIPRPNAQAAIEANKRHVTVKNFDHAKHPLLGNSSKTILGVGAKTHPLLKLSTSFFAGEDAWKRMSVPIKGTRGSFVILRVARGAGITLSDFKPGALSLKRVKANKKEGVKLRWYPKSEVFTFENQNSGVYELAYALADGYALRFDLNLVDGTTQMATFDPNNLPFDPAYEVQPGDENIKPGALPGGITDYSSLRRFVLAAFPFESRVYKSSSDMRTLVKHVRDAMHATYPNLIKKNDIDKFGTDEYTTVDWASDYAAAGVLANKLGYGVTVIKPDPPDGGGGDDGGNYPSAPPTYVGSKAELQQFVLWFLRAEAYKGSSKAKAARVRDKLASVYPHLARVNDMGSRHGYTETNQLRHTDAIVVLGSTPAYDVIIDFVSDVEGPGVFYNKLGWGAVHDTPW